MALDLLESIEDNTHEDEQRGASEELREILRDAEEPCEGGEDGHDAQED